MKACVAIPPIRDFYTTPHRLSGLGAHAVHQLLIKNGVQSVLLNFPAMSKKGTALPLPDELGYLKPFIMETEHGPISFFTGYRHFGPSFESCAGMIAGETPDMVFISCFAYAYAQEAVGLAAEIKRKIPDIMICAGGAGVTVSPGYFSESGKIDYILTGEAEISIPRFIRNLTAKRPGNAGIPEVYSARMHCSEQYKKEAVHTGPEDMEPATAITLETARHVHVSLTLSRGCWKSCRFCSNHLTHGREYRQLPKQIIDSIISNLPSGKKLLINLEDDNLLHDRKYFLSFLRKVHDSGRDALFSAENGLDYMLLDGPLVRELAGLGFRQFNLSLGSMDESILKRENRSAALAHLGDMTHAVHGLGLPSIVYFICGLEGDGPALTCETLLFLHRLPALTGISPYYAVPGIRGFEERGIFQGIPPRLCAGSSAWPWNGTMSTQELITAFRLARLVNFCKKKSLTAIEQELMDVIAATKNLHTIIKEKNSMAVVPVESADSSMTRYLLGRMFE